MYVDRFYLPRNDTHFKPYLICGYYQIATFRAALPYIKNYNVAIDIGAHIGFWSRQLAMVFNRVISYEPQTENFLCLCQNVPINVVTMNWALGAGYGRCSLTTPAEHNTGAFHVSEGDDVRVGQLDGFGWSDIGLIKIDVQGSELAVLKGSEKTLMRNKPVIIVESELDGEKQGEPINFLKELGAEVKRTVKKDTILAWK